VQVGQECPIHVFRVYHYSVHKLTKSALAYIRKHDLLRPGDRVGVAVSGGADSVALLRLLLEIRGELGVVLSVVHLNHQLRGSESKADEQFVREMAAAHDLQFTSESHDVKAYGKKKKLSLETAAREARYAFFKRVLDSGYANKIATAHTLDDQAETVLLKLARGAGTRGIAGIYPRVSPQAMSGKHSAFQHSDKAIVRPLLSTKRSDLESYLAEVRQTWREDSSNQELRHTRNRVRHQILPALERNVNTEVRQALGEAAEIARAEEEFWSQEIANLLPQIWMRRADGGVLDRKRLETFKLAVQRCAIRAAAESLGLNLHFSHVEAIQGLSEEGAAAPLPRGWSAIRHKGEIRFVSATHTAGNYEYRLPVPGKLAVPEADIVIEAVIVRERGCDLQEGEHLLNLPSASDGVIVRNWRAGDRFWPPHGKEPKKIKELLQDRRISGQEKKCWPVIQMGGEVVWVRGFGIRRDFQSKDDAGVLIRDSPLRG
jgi:tRNA(Ile)-lysidine synthase